MVSAQEIFQQIRSINLDRKGLFDGQAELKLLNEDTCEDLELILTPNYGPFQNTSIPFHINVAGEVPRIKCRVNLFHPNISASGDICFNMLGGDAWAKGYALDHYAVGLLWLLSNPNPDSALRGAAAIHGPDQFAKLVARASFGLAIDGCSYSAIRRPRADGLIEAPLALWLSELHTQPEKFVCDELEAVRPMLERLASIGLRVCDSGPRGLLCDGANGSFTLKLVDGNLPTELPIRDYCRIYPLQTKAGLRLFRCAQFQAAVDALLACDITLSEEVPEKSTQQNEATIPVWFRNGGQQDNYDGRLGDDGLSVDFITFMHQARDHPAVCSGVKWPQERIRLLRDTFIMKSFDVQSSERIVLKLLLPSWDSPQQAFFSPLTGELTLSPLMCSTLSPELRSQFGEGLVPRELGELLEVVAASGVVLEDCVQRSQSLYEFSLRAVGTVTATYTDTINNKLSLPEVSVRTLGVGVKDWMRVVKLHDVAELQFLAPGLFQVRSAGPNDVCVIWLLSRGDTSAVFLSESGLSAEAAARLLPAGEDWSIQGQGTVSDLLASSLVLANECVLSQPTVSLCTVSASRRAVCMGSSLHHFLQNSNKVVLRVLNKHLLLRRPANKPQLKISPPAAVPVHEAFRKA